MLCRGLGLRSGDPSKAYLMILHSYLHAPGEICCVLELHLMKLVEVLIQVMVSAQHEELLASCLQRLITLLPDSIVHIYDKLCLAILKALLTHHLDSTPCAYISAAAALYQLNPERWRMIIGEVAVLDNTFQEISTKIAQCVDRSKCSVCAVDSTR